MRYRYFSWCQFWSVDMENKDNVARSPMDMHTFGPSVVLAMVGLSFAFGGAPSAHGLGLVLGRMATSACLALQSR